MHPLLELAMKAARPDVDKKRRAYIGACAVRSDGVIVTARNGSATCVTPAVHAEARVLRKSGWSADVFIARLLKNGQPAMARPCARCRARLRSAGVKFVTYTLDGGSYSMEAI